MRAWLSVCRRLLLTSSRQKTVPFSSSAALSSTRLGRMKPLKLASFSILRLRPSMPWGLGRESGIGKRMSGIREKKWD